MFEIACSLPLTHDLLTQATHPTEPIVTIGLSSGHVQSLRLPPQGEATTSGRRGSNGTDIVQTAWTTRRHKGHCRCVGYSVDGDLLFSAGTDNIVKAADSETGRVVGKVALPHDLEDNSNSPTAVQSLSPQTLLVGTHVGALYLYDLRQAVPSLPMGTSTTTQAVFPRATPSQTHYPNSGDWITSIVPLPPSATSTSGYSKQWLTTGGNTLALTDLRRGVIVKSEQERFLYDMTYISGVPSKRGGGASSGEKVAVGSEDGVIRLWNRGQWDDSDDQIIVARRDEDLECIVEVPDNIGGSSKKVAVGTGEGRVRIVELGKNKVVEQVRHHDTDYVLGLNFDVGGRMISGGGPVLKVWNERNKSDENDEEDLDDDDDDSLSDVDGAGPPKGKKRQIDSDESSVSPEPEDRSKRKKKKKRKGKKGQQGKDTTNGQRGSYAGLD